MPYATTPLATERMPPGVPYIVANEAAERFSFYGVLAILATFLTKSLVDVEGHPAPLDENRANEITHLFIMGVYFFPILGAIISDVWLGKYRTILSLSLLYCAGHAVMALVDFPQLTGVRPLTLMYVALVLLSLGAGGIKPCVSAHVGDQFGPLNKHLLPRVFGWFYFSINFGSTFSMFLTPILLDRESFLATFGAAGQWLIDRGLTPSPALAFGVPGVLMAIATWVFWLGRNKFVHIPPGGVGFLTECFSGAGGRALLNLVPLYLLISAFFALFDQSHTSWVHQAGKMDMTLLGREWKPAQLQVVNPIMVMAFIPLFSYGIYPLMGRLFEVTPLKRICIGMFVAVPSFVMIALAQERIDAGETPSAWRQVGAYAFLTASEIMVSITALEFSYTQAPRKMKSFIMGAYLLLSISLGNFLAAQVNKYIADQREAGRTVLEGASYFWFFAGAVLVMAVVLTIYAQFYRGAAFIQGEE